jgi:hypothetical protein
VENIDDSWYDGIKDNGGGNERYDYSRWYYSNEEDIGDVDGDFGIDNSAEGEDLENFETWESKVDDYPFMTVNLLTNLVICGPMNIMRNLRIPKLYLMAETLLSWVFIKIINFMMLKTILIYNTKV